MEERKKSHKKRQKRKFRKQVSPKRQHLSTNVQSVTVCVHFNTQCGEKLTNSMEQSFYWETNTSSASQEISRILWNPMVITIFKTVHHLPLSWPHINPVHGHPVNSCKQPHYRPWQALMFQGGWSSQILRQSAHEGGKVVSPTHRPPLPPGYIPGTFLLEAESTPGP
jgi:hypothetical protein